MNSDLRNWFEVEVDSMICLSPSFEVCDSEVQTGIFQGWKRGGACEMVVPEGPGEGVAWGL